MRYWTFILWDKGTTKLWGKGYTSQFPLPSFLSHSLRDIIAWPPLNQLYPRLPSQLDYKIDVLERNPKSVSLKCVACTLRRPHLLQSTVACLSLGVCRARCVRGGQTMTLYQSRSQSCSGGQSGLISSITVETSCWTTAERAREREIWHRATGNGKLDFSLRIGWVVACSKALEALKYWWCPKAFSLSMNVTRCWVMMTPSVKGDSDWYWNWDGIGMGWDGMAWQLQLERRWGLAV